MKSCNITRVIPRYNTQDSQGRHLGQYIPSQSSFFFFSLRITGQLLTFSTLPLSCIGIDKDGGQDIKINEEKGTKQREEGKQEEKA